ncbi:Clp protease N-terminal domain-containing protein [Streptomyces sp. NBC_01794]|uniref:Clp protease N-terminal domain-containing protein n=1 Tax=Streptomyces sp. NBC_01794 TaxID=2975942 RepID=UPI00308CDCB4|nr:peptidase [Streptomyces sp. NBC_01794]
MHSPTPRVPRQPTAIRTETDARLTAELALVVAGARRRALRDGDRQIDTAHLLHSLIESVPEVRTVVGDGPQVARVLGYLVQRSIGYGLRWQGSVEDSGTVAVVRDADADADASGWSPSAVTAMEGALERARLRGDAQAGGIDLLACLAADRESRAVEVLGGAGVDAALLAGRIAEMSRHVSQG